jgi:co-chaperonin GroES (HSP10)
MIRPLKDNVLLVLEPDKPAETASGLSLVYLQEKGKAYGHRKGHVLACGPGWRDERGVFRAVEVKPGDCVVVEVTAGDRYTYTKRQDMADMYGTELDRLGISRDAAEFRMIRFDEALAVIESSEVREGSVAAE